MSCVDSVCGTGGWSGPKPGDPDNAVTLSASPVFNGIRVSWTYPRINPHAVMHTLLFRAVSSDFETATEIAVVSGNNYIDTTTEAEPPVYFYWIKLVSVNGTVGNLIGPVSAQARKRSSELLDDLNREIDESLLAEELRTKIDRIDLIERNIGQEILDRLSDSKALGDALNAVQDGTGQALTYLVNETEQRVTQNEAMVRSLQAMAAGVGDSSAAIVAEREARTTKEEAVARDTLALVAKVNENTAAILQETTLRTTKDEVLANQISGLVSVMETENSEIIAALLEEKNTRVTKDEALANSILSLNSRMDVSNASYTEAINTLVTKTNASTTAITQANARIDTTTALVQTESNARVNADSVLSDRITSNQVVVDNKLYAVETKAQVAVNTANTAAGNINVMWTAKVQANGLVGGFGLSNNGQQVDAGFDVDRFWIGKDGTREKPFIVSGGTTYIRKAVIRDADIDTLKLAGGSVTTNFYGQGYQVTIPPRGFWQGAACFLRMPTGSSGVVLTAMVNCMANNGDAGISMIIQRNSPASGYRNFGHTHTSLVNGYRTTAFMSAFDSNPPVEDNYQYYIVLENLDPSDSITIYLSSLVASGGKR